MTLADVAALWKRGHPHVEPATNCVGCVLLTAFEADPDFKLRERIEALEKEVLTPPFSGPDMEDAHHWFARRLREIREGKP